MDKLTLQSLNSFSVADAIRYFSGIQIKDYGGIGGLKTVNIRSLGTHHVGIFYDGIQLGNAQNGQVDLGKFSLENMEEISLYNGQKSEIFQPAKDFGSSGSVYLRSRTPQFAEGKKYNLKATVKGGSFDLIDPSILYEYKFSDRMSASFNAEVINSSGKYKYRYKRVYPNTHQVMYDTTAVRQNGDVFSTRIEAGLYGKIQNFDGYNIGFPYTNGENDKVRGYEMRGYGGYKSKAAGSDSSSSAWVADLSGGYPNVVKSVFFCESAFDAMAFYQWNRKQLTNEIALVSLGGTFSDGQIRQVLNRFPGARPFDCFDNDLPGRIYGLRMMALVENIPLKINRTRDNLEVEANGRSFRLDPERPFQVQVKEHLSVRYDMGQWLPPKAFKDWNDCLLNKPMEVRLHPTKQDQINNLAERRNAGPKL